MQEAVQIENPFEIESAAVSDRGLNESRPENEDSYLDQPGIGIFAVADGVGGAQAGEVASQMAIEILSEAFANMPEMADPEEVMQAAISKANEAIFEMSSSASAAFEDGHYDRCSACQRRYRNDRTRRRLTTLPVHARTERSFRKLWTTRS